MDGRAAFGNYGKQTASPALGSERQEGNISGAALISAALPPLALLPFNVPQGCSACLLALF